MACQRPKVRTAFIAAIGSGVGIALMIGLADMAGLPVASVPFVTSIVLVMAAPNASQAQPRNLIGGHILCAIVGLVVLATSGGGPWSAPMAVALSVAAMQFTDTMHPPAGISPFLIVILKPSWTFLLIPVAVGALFLAAFAYVFHRITDAGVWPHGGPPK